MSINLPLADLATMLGIAVAIGTSYWGLIKVIARTFEKGLEAKFKAQDEARQEGRKEYLERIARIEQQQLERIARLEEQQRATEKQLIELLISLPREYTRREDHVQAIASIMVKIDNLALKVESSLRDMVTKGGRE